MKDGREMVVQKLPYKKKGRPILLGDYVDKQFKAYAMEIHCMGLVLITSVLIAAAVLHNDSNLLKENGGHLNCQPTGQREGTENSDFQMTKASLTHVDFEERKAQFVFDAQAIIE